MTHQNEQLSDSEDRTKSEQLSPYLMNEDQNNSNSSSLQGLENYVHYFKPNESQFKSIIESNKTIKMVHNTPSYRLECSFSEQESLHLFLEEFSLIIHNVPEIPGENCAFIFQDFASNFVQLGYQDILLAKRLMKTTVNTMSDFKDRPILVCLFNKTIVETILHKQKFCTISHNGSRFEINSNVVNRISVTVEKPKPNEIEIVLEEKLGFQPYMKNNGKILNFLFVFF